MEKRIKTTLRFKQGTPRRMLCNSPVRNKVIKKGLAKGILYITNWSDPRVFTTWQEFQNVTKKYMYYRCIFFFLNHTKLI